MAQREDAELVNAARQGDKQAFGQLVERYQAMAHRLALRMTDHEDLATDLAQEAILQAYLSLDRLRQPGRFGSWLYGIVLNVCRGYFRDQKIDFASLESMTGGLRYDGPLLGTTAIDPLEVVEARELQQMVLAAVQGLSDKNRDAVLLFYYEALSVREIAALLETSVSAVKSRLHQSRRQLKQSLALQYLGGQSTESIAERRAAMVKVTIADIVVNVKTEHRIVVLADEKRQRILPIWIGPFEADAILFVLKAVATARPITHDFLANILKATEMTLEEVRIEAIKEETFYAVVKLRHGDQVHEVDARPSDAIALAVRTGSPIYASEALMAETGRELAPEGQEMLAIENWYYSPLRGMQTDFPVEELEKLQPQGGRFIVPEKKQPGQEEAPSEGEQAKRKAEQLKERQELAAFVFGEWERPDG